MTGAGPEMLLQQLWSKLRMEKSLDWPDVLWTYPRTGRIHLDSGTLGLKTRSTCILGVCGTGWWQNDERNFGTRVSLDKWNENMILIYFIFTSGFVISSTFKYIKVIKVRWQKQFVSCRTSRQRRRWTRSHSRINWTGKILRRRWI